MMRALLVFAGVALAAPTAHAYQFLCNGYRITGYDQWGCPTGYLDAPQPGDCPCSASSPSSAPSWFGSQLALTVESEGGNGITSSQFVAEVRGAAARWNAVTCSDLLIDASTTIPAQSSARFGSSSSEHGVFFVTTEQEWFNVSGSGAGGTLGVTLAPYYSSTCSSREFYDADIIINGFVQFGWTADEIASTISHEVGHAFGLGHPCLTGNLNCNNSCQAIMAASGGDYPTPQQDDINGVCALYRGEPGGLGASCNTAAQCVTAPLCITYEGFSYCSQTCGTCPTDYQCRDVGGQDVCVRKGAPQIGDPCSGLCIQGATCIDGECREDCNPNAPNCSGQDFRCVPLRSGGGVCFPPGTQQLGELCGQQAGDCAPGLICLSSAGGSTCHKECTPGQPAACGTVTERCLDAGGFGYCVPAAGPNGNCDATGYLCQLGYTCIGDPVDVSRCRKDCNPGAANDVCGAGFVCLPLSSGGGACFPGGDKEEGEFCASGSDCIDGATCVTVSANAAECLLLCNPGNPFCPHGGQTCIGLTGSPDGVCSPAGGTGVGCACDATTACDANCTCDPECAGNCPCDSSSTCTPNCQCDTDCTACACNIDSACSANCGCDPDCNPGACMCNTSSACQANCNCDPDCGGSCTCDVGPNCTKGCNCDEDCIVAGICSDVRSCGCDCTTACDPDPVATELEWVDCRCDPECPCDCDLTDGCDDCACDFDCFEEESCAAVQPGWIAALLGLLGLRRRRQEAP